MLQVQAENRVRRLAGSFRRAAGVTARWTGADHKTGATATSPGLAQAHLARSCSEVPAVPTETPRGLDFPVKYLSTKIWCGDTWHPTTWPHLLDTPPELGNPVLNRQAPHLHMARHHFDLVFAIARDHFRRTHHACHYCTSQ